MALRWLQLAILSAAWLCLVCCDREAAVAPENGKPTVLAAEEEPVQPLAHTHGSFVLVYDIKVADGDDANTTVDESIVALAKRIDPVGAAGLKYRNLGAGQMEIRGPLPPPDVVRMREELIASIDRLMAENLSRAEIELALFRPPNREPASAMAAMIGRHPKLDKEIRTLFASFDAFEKNRGAYLDVDALIEMLRSQGVLEFRIAPEPSRELLTYHEALRKDGPDANRDEPFLWFEIDDVRNILLEPEDRKELEADPRTYLATLKLVGAEHAGKYYVLLSNQLRERLTDADANWRVTLCHESRDGDGDRAIAFNLDVTGANLLGELTQRHRGRMLAVVLDGKSIMIATIQSRIDSAGMISRAGGFSIPEAQRLLRTLDAGTLKVRLSPKPTSVTFEPVK